jgi:hypothetical protein
VTRAHRAWALDHPSEHLLLYGHTGLRITPNLLREHRRPEGMHAWGSATYLDIIFLVAAALIIVASLADEAADHAGLSFVQLRRPA